MPLGEACHKGDNRVPLLMAAYNGHLPVVQYLCEQGVDKEVRDGNNRTPLDIATGKGQTHVIRYPQGKAQQCDLCGKTYALKCSLCHAAFYCNAECQKKAWKAHKKQCTGYKKM